MQQSGFSPAPDQRVGPEDHGAAPLDPGETVVAEAAGVTLGWQPQTILIWWLPGLIFIGLAWLEFRSVIVVIGLTVFCAALFAFYASDREVRPRSLRKQYLLTDRRLWVGTPGPEVVWRPLLLQGIAATKMEHGIADRVVGRLSAAATIVLVMRDPGPKGEPRRVRIGPMRRPEAFRAAIDARI